MMVLLALNSCELIRVRTRHYEPFIYQDANGKFGDGIEFQLIQTIAKELNMEVEFGLVPEIGDLEIANLP